MSHKNKEQFGIEDNYTVHHILAHSYYFYFLLFLLGIVLDFVYPIKIFQNPAIKPLGIIFLIISSILIIWAQKTSNDLKKNRKNKQRSLLPWTLLLYSQSYALGTFCAYVRI